ncbi:hypothetical protein EDD95_5661 [Streptomyces sp. CEV 2-1]|nr:hypothetical protein EDD95_5661 [Streptomyces sp. CEV 2-1]
MGERVDQSPGVGHRGVQQDGGGLAEIDDGRLAGAPVAGAPQGSEVAGGASGEPVGGEHGSVCHVGPPFGCFPDEPLAENGQVVGSLLAQTGDGVEVAAQDGPGQFSNPVRSGRGRRLEDFKLAAREQGPCLAGEGGGECGGIGLVAGQAPHRRGDSQQLHAPGVRGLVPVGEIGVRLGDLRQRAGISAPFSWCAGELAQPGEGQAVSHAVEVVCIGDGGAFEADLVAQDVRAQLGAHAGGGFAGSENFLAEPVDGAVVVLHAAVSLLVSVPRGPAPVSAAW